MDLAIIIVYTLALLLIFIYSLSQLNLLLNYLRSKKQADLSPKTDLSKPENVPFVTIQLPVYNEKYVMERLLTNISKIDYPRGKSLKSRCWTILPMNLWQKPPFK